MLAKNTDRIPGWIPGRVSHTLWISSERWTHGTVILLPAAGVEFLSTSRCAPLQDERLHLGAGTSFSGYLAAKKFWFTIAKLCMCICLHVCACSKHFFVSSHAVQTEKTAAWTAGESDGESLLHLNAGIYMLPRAHTHSASVPRGTCICV